MVVVFVSGEGRGHLTLPRTPKFNLFGDALSRNIPVRTVVSRGVRSLTQEQRIVSSIDSEIEETDDRALPRIFHTAREVQNRATGERLAWGDWTQRFLN